MRAFLAMLARDVHVARRNLLPMLVQTLLQPMLFVVVFGRIMTGSGLMQEDYKSLLLPGIVAISMIFSGIQGVAFPLIADFQHTREIEDRLLAPLAPGWLAIEKVVAGMLQALLAGAVVIPTAWVVMGSGIELSLSRPLLLLAVALLGALLAAGLGLVLGCSIPQQFIGLMFSLVLAPMFFFGCTYYPWSALASFPILQKVVLVNPMVYASEGLRAALTPYVAHLPVTGLLVALVLFDSALLYLGLERFDRKAIG